MRRLPLPTGALLGALIFGGATSHAATITYGFGDEYWIKSGTAFSTAFPGATGTAAASGVYQETATGGSPVITELLATSFSTGSHTVPISGEFTQNDGGSALVINGWSSLLFNATTTPSYKIGAVQSNPAAISLQYLTGATVNTSTGAFSGTVSAFNLDSINLYTAAYGTATSYIVEGLLGDVVEYSEQICNNGPQYAVGPVNGSCGPYNPTATVPFNWSDIDTVEFGYMSGGVFHTGWPTNGTLDMTNIAIDTNLAPVPEPISIALLGVGLLGIGLIRHRRSHPTGGLIG